MSCGLRRRARSCSAVCRRGTPSFICAAHSVCSPSRRRLPERPPVSAERSLAVRYDMLRIEWEHCTLSLFVNRDRSIRSMRGASEEMRPIHYIAYSTVRVGPPGVPRRIIADPFLRPSRSLLSSTAHRPSHHSATPHRIVPHSTVVSRGDSHCRGRRKRCDGRCVR